MYAPAQSDFAPAPLKALYLGAHKLGTQYLRHTNKYQAIPKIILAIEINAPAQVCFDLSRSIDLHMRSADQTGERAVAGVVSGLIGANQTVTWQAKHFGIIFSLTSKISAFDPPKHFRDSMTSGPFARIDHDHYFESKDANTTTMRDVFDFNSPLGPLGALVDALVLTRYMRDFLVKRNAEIKHIAETNPSQYL